MYLNNTMVNNNLRFAMIFALSFVGNALFLSIPLMLFLICFCSILLWKQQNILNNKNITVSLFIISALLFFFTKNLMEPRAYDQFYFLWPIYLSLFIFFCSKEDIFGSFYPPIGITFFLAIFFLWGAMNYEDETGRAYFIFGANVLYRLFLFLSFLQIIHSNNTLLKLLFFLIGITGVYLTGSRMGLMLAISLYSLYFLSPYNNFNVIQFKKLSRIFLILPLLLVAMLINSEEISAIYNLLLSSEGMISRLLMLSGGSISIRVDFLTSFLEHFSIFGTSSHVFNFFYFKSYFPYPHNIIAELIFYYGFVGILFSFIVLFEYSKTFFRFLKKTKLPPIEIAFLIIFPSCLASGDIVDGLLVLFYSFVTFLIWCSNLLKRLELAYLINKKI